jgi:hypothetical protein
MGMNGNEQTLMDGRLWIDKAKWTDVDGQQTNVNGQRMEAHKRWIEL